MTLQEECELMDKIGRRTFGDKSGGARPSFARLHAITVEELPNPSIPNPESINVYDLLDSCIKGDENVQFTS